MIDSGIRNRIQPLFDLAAYPFLKFGISPNYITVAAFVTGLFSALALGFHMPFTAVALLWLSGFLDVIDGTVARRSKRSSKAGGFMDLVFDRVVETMIIIGFYFFLPGNTLLYLLFLSSVIFNFSTFLIAATLYPNTGEKSVHFDVGIMERTETFLFFTAAILFTGISGILFTAAVALIYITGGIRFYKVIHYGTNIDKAK